MATRTMMTMLPPTELALAYGFGLLVVGGLVGCVVAINVIHRRKR